MQYIQKANKVYIQIIISLNLVPVTKLLAGTKLDQKLMSQIEFIDMDDSIQIVKNMNHYSSNPNWATELGNHLGIATHGPVGFAAISAPTVGKAISTFVEWFQIRNEFYTSKVIEKDENFEIIIEDTTGDQSYQLFFFESFMRGFEILITQLLGHPPTNETTIFFENMSKNRQVSVKKVYDSLLHFNADNNKFVISKTLWFSPSPLSEPDSHALNLQKCKQLMAESDFGNRVDLMIKNVLRQHFENILVENSLVKNHLTQNKDQLLPTFKRMSELSHHTERTLSRKLRKLGVSYKDLLREERKNLVDKLLKDGRYTIIDISYLLGYNEPASFCRAFKTWFGMKPSQYRRNMKY